MLSVNNLEYIEKKNKFRIDNVSFSLDDGYLMCLLGPNASGKTTLLDLIFKRILPKSGSVSFDGKIIETGDISSFRQVTAYISAESAFTISETPDQHTDLIKLLYSSFDMELYEHYMNVFELNNNTRNTPIYNLSTGQQIEYALACTFARKPRLILMDEPLANLDPVIKTDLTSIIHQYIMDYNTSVIMSTHLLDDITDICDYIGLMDNGKLVKFGNRIALLDDVGCKDLKDFIRVCGKNDQ